MTQKEARSTEEVFMKRAQAWALKVLGSGPDSALPSHFISLGLNSLTYQSGIKIPALITPFKVVMRTE